MAFRDYLQDSFSEVRRARQQAGVPGMVGAAVRQATIAPQVALDATARMAKRRAAPLGTVARYAAGGTAPNMSPIQDAAAQGAAAGPAQGAVPPQQRDQIFTPPSSAPTTAASAPTRSTGPVSRNLALPERQTSFNQSDLTRYQTDAALGGGDKTYTPVSQRIADLNAGIRAFQDLGEYKEAASMGVSQETYQQQKDIRRFGKDNAARLAEQRRGVVAENVAGAPQRRAQEIANETAGTVQDLYRRLAQTNDPAEVETLVQSILATQGKSPDYETFKPITEKAQIGTDALGQPVYGERTTGAFSERTGEARPFGPSQPAEAGKVPLPDGLYELPGVGRVTVRGGKAYDEKGNQLQ